MSKVVLGIDIGGTNTVLGLVDSEGNCSYQDKMPTLAQKTSDDFFRRLFEFIVQMKNKISQDTEIIGIGIGAPNANYYTGVIENAANLKWDYVNVVDIVKTELNLPAVITNDANAAALGEMKFGAAKGMKNFIEITLGTGLGSGLVVNGEVVYGHDGFAGELGHVIVKRKGRECGCGRRGCLETYASATGIKRTFFELQSRAIRPSSLSGVPFPDLDAKMIYDAAKEGDEIALIAFEETAKVLGFAFADAVAYLSPEAFILFGGLAGASDLLIEPAKRIMENNLLPVFQNKVKILPSKLQGSDSAILGASALMWHELTNS